MKKLLKKSFAYSAATMSLAGVLVSPASQVFAQEENEEGILDFESIAENEGEAIEGGTLKYALVGDPFEGLLNNMVYGGNPDATIITFFNPGLYGYDENFGIDNSGFADIEFNQEEKTVTISIPQDAKWDDGEPITIDDVIFPYYVIGHPDYTGIRYGSDYENVEGMTEYHEGKAEEISGLERVDDYTLKVHYINFNNSLLQAGGGVSSYIEPEHILKDVPVAELEDSEYVRQNPVGFGPFKVESVTAGESVVLAANEYYYKGKPKIDKVQIDVVNPTSVVAELKAGNYDIADLPSDQYETYKDATNFKTIGMLENAYTYIGFKMGKWDAEKGEVVYDESKVTSNKALRQAMAYAVDNNAIAKEFYHGIRQAANALVTPNFTEDFYNKDQEGYNYDPEKAKQILADAGFKDSNGDGFVEDPNGKEFKLGFASMSGGETAEPLAQYYMQMWAEIGVNVELVDGRLMEFNSFYDRIQKDDEAIDIYQAAWGTGGDPNPSGLYGRKAAFNFTRWATEENDKLIQAIESDDSFDTEFRKKAFYDWQAYVHEEVPVFPTLFRYKLTAVNNRVNKYDVTIGSDLDWTEIYLTADAPVAE
ncbi:oligopeptide ABC transporter substrate-binding protein [Ignavigranum ruoffiae]